MGSAKKEFNVCVIGGGLAGLSAAHYLVRYGVRDVVVLERRSRFGGLLLSEVINGFTFDAGGSHIVFSRSADVVKEMLSMLDAPIVTHRRNSKVRYGDMYVKYPFEVGIGALPPQEKFECLKSVIDAYVRRVSRETRPPTNFLEWIRYVFGDAIAEKYLIPYNRKLWKTDLRKITLEWVGGRVPNPPLDDVIRAAVGLEVEAYKHQLIFSYPALGGIEALIKSLVKLLRRECVKLVGGSEVSSISPHDGRLDVSCRNGLSLRCRAIIYTAPLSRGGAILKDVLGRYATELRRLKSVSLVVTGVGLEGVAPPYHWIYFPGEGTIFHRVGILSNYSPANAPPNSVALIAETSVRNLGSHTIEAIESSVLDGLKVLNIVADGAVRVVKSWVWEDAYVLYDKDRDEVLRKVLPELRSSHIFPHGRFGSWSYMNMDAVLESSRCLARELTEFLSKVR